MGTNRLTPVLLVVGLSLLFTACGTTSGNTLAQDLAHDRFKSCQNVTNNIFLDRIDADGRVHVHMINGTAGYQEWSECMGKAAEVASSASPTSSTPVATPAIALPASIEVPTWFPGDEWAFRWENPAGQGTQVWSVDRMEKVDGIEHIVIKQGTLEIYSRALDGIWTLAKRSGEVSQRYAPGWEPSSCPVSVGKRWENRYTDERITERTTNEIARTCLAEAEETVMVPAGTFTTVEIVCKNARTDRVVYRLWYSPVVKQMVRRVWHVSGGIDTRELIAYKVR